MAITNFPFKVFPDLTLYQELEPLASLPIPWTTSYIRQRISAGFPSPASDYEEDGLDFNAFLVSNRNSTFIFTVVGDSMQRAGIMDGDKVTVDRSVNPKHGHIVIAQVNNEYTIKRLYMRDGVFELRPENPKFPPIRFTECDEVKIWGVVTGCARKFAV